MPHSFRRFFVDPNNVIQLTLDVLGLLTSLTSTAVVFAVYPTINGVSDCLVVMLPSASDAISKVEWRYHNLAHIHHGVLFYYPVALSYPKPLISATNLSLVCSKLLI